MSDTEMLLVVLRKLGERMNACHAVEVGADDGYTAEARQAIREEKMWLTALAFEIKDHMDR